jgi:hemerythrin
MNVDKFLNSGNSFIDENHNDLLEHFEALNPSTEHEWDLNIFQAKLRDFIFDIENHFSHEEIVLQGARYKNINAHTLSHRKIGLEMHQYINSEIKSPSEAKIILSEIHHSIISHELMEDQNYWHLFDDFDINQHRLIEFTEDMLTGDADIDKEHVALLNHINRYYMKAIANEDIESMCKELDLLVAYSTYHFRNEEAVLGEKLRKGHKANHEKLVNDLIILIAELKQGKFKMIDLKEYLYFWFYNHITQYDVPAFKQ